MAFPYNGIDAVAIGTLAGKNSQGTGAIAIGLSAGQGTTTGQGANAIAIGSQAGVASQTAGSICLNASGSALNPAQAGFFINPVRTDATNTAQTCYYNATTKEITYNATVAPSTSTITAFDVNINTQELTSNKKTLSSKQTNTTIVKTSNITATLDAWSTINQTYTFGQSIPNRWVASGRSGATNLLAY